MLGQFPVLTYKWNSSLFWFLYITGLLISPQGRTKCFFVHSASAFLFVNIFVLGRLFPGESYVSKMIVMY